ncbi:MAG TPA: phosphatidate cytidylyltransferase [Candidatus Polarisedimenticolaceae bacterium]|nr:phosphatidate cytidylyltransferase [Candidatus Polarisedimenticolaceae bacterium]
MTRLLTASLLIPAAWYLCKKAPFPLFLAALAAVVGLAAWEALGLFETRGAKPFRWGGTIASLAFVWAYAGLSPRLDPIDVLVALFLVIPVGAMVARAGAEAMLDAITGTIVPVALVGVGLAHCAALRAVPGENGSDLLMLAMVCATLSDTGAYYLGSAFGKHPLAPSISPKKTWEGVLGGWAASLFGAGLAHFWFFQRLSIVHAAVLGTLLCAAGIAGDLAESLLKRAAGAKDSSSLLPGHGGVLDRVDSLMVAAPVLYYYWRAFLVGVI